MSNWRTPPEPIPEEEIKFTHQADVVVVGLAHAGSAAVRAAAEAGAKVIGLEEKSEKVYSVWGKDVGTFQLQVSGKPRRAQGGPHRLL